MIDSKFPVRCFICDKPLGEAKILSNEDSIDVVTYCEKCSPFEQKIIKNYSTELKSDKSVDYEFANFIKENFS